MRTVWVRSVEPFMPRGQGIIIIYYSDFTSTRVDLLVLVSVPRRRGQFQHLILAAGARARAGAAAAPGPARHRVSDDE